MHTYQLGAPMSWKEFKALPDDLKRTYILNLREKFNVNSEALGQMMGICGSAIRRICIDLGLSDNVHRKMSAKQAEEWKNFYTPARKEASEEDETIERDEEEVKTMDIIVDLPKHTEEKKSGCEINTGTVVFTGKAPDIAIALMKFLGDKEYNISVAFTAVTEG